MISYTYFQFFSISGSTQVKNPPARFAEMYFNLGGFLHIEGKYGTKIK